MNDNRSSSFRQLIMNERGSVLLYSLLILMVLMVVTPMILASISTEKYTSTRMEDNIQVNVLASSAMEVFVGKLKAGMSVTQFKAYSGWGTRTITLANGKKVELQQTAKKASDDSVLDVSGSSEAALLTALKDEIIVTVKASSGKASPKIYKYNVKGIEGKMVVKLSPTVDVTGSSVAGKKYVIAADGSAQASGKYFKMDGAGIRSAIREFLSKLKTTVDETTDGYKDVPAVCNGCTVKKETGDLIIDGNDWDNAKRNITYGSLTNPVVLIVNNTLTIKNNGSLTVWGDLVVNNQIVIENKSKLYVKKSKGQYGNVYTNLFNSNTNGDIINVENMIYADNNFQVSGDDGTNDNTAITAGSINVRQNIFQVNGRAHVVVTDYIITERIDSLSAKYSNFFVNNGDILAADYMNIDGASVSNANGLLVAGNKLDLKGSSELTTHGKTTMLQCSDGSPIFSGCSSGSLSFNFDRK